VKIFVGRVAFDQLGPQRAAALNSVETAFKLPPEQVDMVISAGHDAVKNSSAFRAFLVSLGGHPPPRRVPIATPGDPAAPPLEAAAQ
jgi:NTE family protein